MDPTEDAQPVVDGDDDHIAVASQDAAVKHVASSLHVGTAVDEDHHRFWAATLPNVCGDGDRKQAGGTGKSTHTAGTGALFFKKLIGVFVGCFEFVFFLFVCLLLYIFFSNMEKEEIAQKRQTTFFFAYTTMEAVTCLLIG